MSPISTRRPNRTLRATLGGVVLGVIVALSTSLGLAGVAAADTTVSEAAAALRGGESVFVAPDADPSMGGAEADQLRAQIAGTGYPFFVALLPTSAAVDSSADATLKALRDEVGLSGTYALYIGNAFRAGDTQGRVSDLATQAYREHSSEGTFAVLESFVASAGERITGKSGTPVNGAAVGAVLLGGAALVGGGGYYVYRRNQKVTAERTAAVRRTVDEDVTSYGEVVARLDVDDPRLDDSGRADAQRALDAYESAKKNAELMRRPEDAATVTTSLEDGRYAVACVDARIDGRPVPERRAPCFVDPRHGPSVEDVTWAPDGGAPRPIPVCTACASTLAAGQLPAPREVEVGGARVPYWSGGRAYAPYAGGYYATSGADTMSLLFMGAMLGGAFSGPGYGGGASGGDSSSGGGWGSGGGSGDFGGGGGGGDFGGGDFGGGGDF